MTVKNTLDTDEVRYFVGEDKVENAFTDVTGGTEVTAEVYRDGVKIWSDAATVTITARPVTAYGSTSKVYDGSAALLENVALTLAGVAGNNESGVVVGDDLSVAPITANSASYAMADKHENRSLVTENAGGLLALISLSGADAANYTLESVTALGSITPQSITPGPDPDPDPSYDGIEISGPDNQVYDGDYQLPEIVVTDSDGNRLAQSNDGVTGDFVVKYDNNVNATSEGNFATVTITGINNYTGEVTKSFEIAPAEATILVNDSSKVYGTDDPEGYNGYSVVLTGTDRPLYTNVESGTVDTLGTVTVIRPRADIDENVDVYVDALGATVEGQNANYTYTVDNGKFTITPADGNEVTIDHDATAEGFTKVYDGDPISIEASATKEGSTLWFSTDEGDEKTWSTKKPSITNVGTLTIYVKATNPNYMESAVVSATVQVTERPVTITINDAAKVFDGTELTNETHKVTSGSFVEGETYGMDFGDSGQTAVGVSENDATVVFAGEGNEYTAQAGNYNVTVEPGTLQVFPQSIDPEDPDPENPDPDDPNPGDPDPDNPDQPFYTGATVNEPQNTVYNGTDQAWLPTVVSDEGVTLTQSTDGGETGDYIVSYGNSTINAGHIVVTIKGCGNYAGAVTREYNILPATITVHANNHSKVQGQADPSLTSWYEGAVGNEIPGWTGFISRAAGETPGQYAIGQNTLQLADGQNGFLESNYTLEFVGATFTITPAPVTPDGGDDTPVTPVTPVNPVPGPDDGADDATDDAETEAIDDDETPLTESIEDDDTPLASGREDRDCWVHWFMFVGLAVSAIYYIGALIHRRKFTGDLKSYEDSVLNPDDQNRA